MESLSRKGPSLETLLPHRAKMVTMKLKGEQIRQILSQSAPNLKPVDPSQVVGGLIQGSGIVWTMDLNAEMGNRGLLVTGGFIL